MDQRRAIRVFLVERSRETRHTISAALARHNIRVIGEGATVDDCVAAILRSRPDVVVLDVALHDGTGLHLINRIQPLCAGVRFVVCTNDVEAQYRERYLKSGAKAFLDKSAAADQLPDVIAAVCGR